MTMYQSSSPATYRWLNYWFYSYRKDGPWNPVPGLYIFVGRQKDWQNNYVWQPLYVGQTENFSDRLGYHELWNAAVQLGATDVHARSENNPVLRTMIERQLIQAYQPPLNVKLK